MQARLKKIETTYAPQAIGPYSQGIVVEAGQKLLFVSGQLPVDPQTGKLIKGDIRALTKQVIDNLEAVLEASGSSLNRVVRTDVFLKNLSEDFVAMNEVYATRFLGEVTPVRQTIQADLPMGSPVEISCIAIC